MQNLISLLGYLLAAILLICSSASCNLPTPPPNVNQSSYISITNSHACLFSVENEYLKEPFTNNFNPNIYALVMSDSKDTLIRYINVSYAQKLMTWARVAILTKELGAVYQPAELPIKMELVWHTIIGKSVLVTKRSTWDNSRGVFWKGVDGLCRDSIVLTL